MFVRFGAEVQAGSLRANGEEEKESDNDGGHKDPTSP